MRLFLIGNYELQETRSMHLYCKLLKKKIRCSKIKINIIRAKPFFSNFNLHNKFLKKWFEYLDKYLIFGLILFFKVKPNDIVHICDHANSLLYLFLRTKKIIITCHDLINIKLLYKNNNKSLKKDLKITGKIYQYLIIFFLKKIKYIVCVSINTKIELIKYLKINKDNIFVIYNSINQNFNKIKIKKYSLTNKFLLHVGGNNWYKNKQCVIKTFYHLTRFSKYQDYKLVLAGSKLNKEMKILISRLKINHKVKNIIDPKTSKLSELYANSEGLIFPSVEEGFGWPIIEAQLHGCPVYIIDKSPMNEIANKACIFIYSYKYLKNAHIINNTNNIRKKIIELGFNNLKRFKLKKFTSSYSELYLKLI